MDRIDAGDGIAAVDPGPGRERVPDWAGPQRRLLERQADAAARIVEEYLDADDEPFWPPEDHVGLDGGDDVLEGFHNWPLTYAMGADEELLDLARRAYEGCLARLGRTETPYGHAMVVEEYEQCRDWFHQGEGNQLFYGFGLADPAHDRTVERARRFADFYVEAGEPLNYDHDRRLVRGPMNGSMGPDYCDYELYEHHPYGADYRWMRHGLPWRDLEFESAADIDDPANEERVFEVLNERCSTGDVPLNLGITSLVTNAYLHTGEERYREFVSEYVEAWRDRVAENGGIVPDNVDRDGEIGGVAGNWYGGKYGWSWGGWHYIGVGTTVGSENATLLTGDTEPMAFLRSQLDVLRENAIEGSDPPPGLVADSPDDVGPDQLSPEDLIAGATYLPHKHGDPGNYHYHGSGLRTGDDEILFRDGWYEFHPMGDQPYGVHLWTATFDDDDRERIADIEYPDAWKDIRYRPAGKHGGGEEYSWLAYLDGRFPDYPELFLEAAHERVDRQVERLEDEQGTVENLYEDYLRDRNPVQHKALLQLTMGAPQPVYYGGLIFAQVRHFDPQRDRPGLPEDVAALVSDVDAGGITLELANVGDEDRDVVVQAGAYGEHTFERVAPAGKTGDATGGAAGDGQAIEPGEKAFRVTVPGQSTVELDASVGRFDNDPTYAYPWW